MKENERWRGRNNIVNHIISPLSKTNQSRKRKKSPIPIFSSSSSRIPQANRPHFFSKTYTQQLGNENPQAERNELPWTPKISKDTSQISVDSTNRVRLGRQRARRAGQAEGEKLLRMRSADCPAQTRMRSAAVLRCRACVQRLMQTPWWPGQDGQGNEFSEEETQQRQEGKSFLLLLQPSNSVT